MNEIRTKSVSEVADKWLNGIMAKPKLRIQTKDMFETDFYLLADVMRMQRRCGLCELGEVENGIYFVL